MLTLYISQSLGSWHTKQGFGNFVLRSKTFVFLRFVQKNLCALRGFFVDFVILIFLSLFFFLDKKETKNQGSRKIAKIYCM
jgi:predicted PurR-regulated permease PerM